MQSLLRAGTAVIKRLAKVFLIAALCYYSFTALAEHNKEEKYFNRQEKQENEMETYSTVFFLPPSHQLIH
jgi:hypothetical protein